MKVTAYLAAPLFSQAERCWNRELAKTLEGRIDGLKIVLPQDYYIPYPSGTKEFAELAFSSCMNGLKECNLVIAILDGPGGDDGTCFEVGYARGKDKPVIGVRTDFRQNDENGCNIMLSRGCTMMVCQTKKDEDIVTLAEDIIVCIKKIFPNMGA